jgi:hypothetical protein
MKHANPSLQMVQGCGLKRVSRDASGSHEYYHYAWQAAQELSRGFGEHLILDLSTGAEHIISFAPELGDIKIRLLGWRDEEAILVEKKWLRRLTRAPLYPVVLSLTGVRAYTLEDTAHMEHYMIENFIYRRNSNTIRVETGTSTFLEVHLHSFTMSYSVLYDHTPCGWYHSEEVMLGIPLFFGQSWWITYS